MSNIATASTSSLANAALLEVEQLCVEFRSSAPQKLFGKPATFRALDGIDLTLRRGETLGLIGESGSGKSTLGRAIMGLTRSSSGAIRFQGDDIAQLSPTARKPYLRNLQMVFQDPYSSLHPRQTVGRSLEEPLRIQGTVEKARRRDRVLELLHKVGLQRSHADLYPLNLSGGQRQRVGRAAIMDAAEPGGLGGTYAGSPIACAAALAVLDVIKDEGLVARANEVGATMRAALERMSQRNDAVPMSSIRGPGAMVAFDIVTQRGTNTPDAETTKKVVQAALGHGLVLLSCGVFGNTVRLLCPLTISDALLGEGLDLLERALVSANA